MSLMINACHVYAVCNLSGYLAVSSEDAIITRSARARASRPGCNGMFILVHIQLSHTALDAAESSAEAPDAGLGVPAGVMLYTGWFETFQNPTGTSRDLAGYGKGRLRNDTNWS